jgi:hypothetical protein
MVSNMDSREIEKYIVDIMSGERIITLANGNIFIFRNPTLFEKTHAHYIYEQSLKDYKSQGMQSSEDLINIAKESNEWTDVDSSYMDKFDEIIDFAKKQIDQAIGVGQKKRIEKQISKAKDKRKIIASRYHYLTSHGIEQQAIEDKIRMMIRHVTERIDRTPLWSTQNDFDNETDYGLLTELVGMYLSDDLNLEIKDIREIARSAQWRIRWGAGKDDLKTLFGVDVRDLSDIQFSLMYWSQVYDSVYMSMDCPPDNIIEDDDKLDMWLKDREKEQSQQRRNKAIDKKTGRKGFYDEQTGKFHAHGKSVMDHKEVGYIVDGEFDENGIFRYYTLEEKRAKIAEIHEYNTPEVRRMLQSEHNRVKDGQQIREEKLRQGRSRHIIGTN